MSIGIIVKETDKYFVLDAVRKVHEKSGGHNGLLFTDLANQVNIPVPELKETCNELVREKKITWHEGVHGIMFKLKVK